MSVEPFWDQIQESALRQGDYLPRCMVPGFGPDFALAGTHEVTADEYDAIVLTQSCDLEQRKVRLVAVCPIYPLIEFEAVNPAFAKKGRWNEVLKGRVEGLHLLSSPTNPANNRDALVVDFREIYSLPFDYLVSRASQLGSRWRLRSPYLEHFSQAFARFFMRVGLPSTIPLFP
ncbi:MAG: hypothetical protein ACYC3I_11700 [Gemmataceae bacterium]